MPVQGGLFDGSWEAASTDLVVDAVGAVGDKALEVWRANLDNNIRVNHGRYVSQTRVTRIDDEHAQVHDGMSVYGPWLEGQGSRNAPVTRFEGYHSAQDAAEKVAAMVDEVSMPAVARFVEVMNR